MFSTVNISRICIFSFPVVFSFSSTLGFSYSASDYSVENNTHWTALKNYVEELVRKFDQINFCSIILLSHSQNGEPLKNAG